MINPNYLRKEIKWGEKEKRELELEKRRKEGVKKEKGWGEKMKKRRRKEGEMDGNKRNNKEND